MTRLPPPRQYTPPEECATRVLPRLPFHNFNGLRIASCAREADSCTSCSIPKLCPPRKRVGWSDPTQLLGTPRAQEVGSLQPTCLSVRGQTPWHLTRITFFLFHLLQRQGEREASEMVNCVFMHRSPFRIAEAFEISSRSSTLPSESGSKNFRRWERISRSALFLTGASRNGCNASFGALVIESSPNSPVQPGRARRMSSGRSQHRARR